MCQLALLEGKELPQAFVMQWSPFMPFIIIVFCSRLLPLFEHNSNDNDNDIVNGLNPGVSVVRIV